MSVPRPAVHSPADGLGPSTIVGMGRSHEPGDHSDSMDPRPELADSIASSRHAALTSKEVINEPHDDNDGNDSDGDLSGPLPTARRIFTLPQLMALFACSFSYAFIFNTINNIVIPKEIERLATSRQSMWVGAIMGAGAISQLATPVVGAASDRIGQRTTYLVYGSVTTVVGIILFLATVTVNDLPLLFCAHVVTSVGLSMQYSMVTALLNDHVVEEQVGKGSGTMAILAIVGSGAGYIMFALNLSLYYSYISYIVSTFTCLCICLAVVPAPVDGQPPRRKLLQPTSTVGRICSDVAHALSVPSPKKYPDFFFACLGRALFNTGLAGQVYLVYYFRDVLNSDNPTQLASVVAVMALVGGVVGALPAGMASDRLGKKPVIYWSIAVCIVALISFMLAYNVTGLQLIGFIYGVGNVAYLSVDYALGVNSLPRRPGNEGRRGIPIDAAKDLGVFAMSATAGQLFGQVVYAAVLEQFSFASPSGFMQYTYWGFVGIYGVGCMAFFLSGVATTFIRAVK
jgi:MFS family permease